MDEPGLLMPGGGTDTPGGYVRLALLVTLLTVIATAVPFFLVYRPVPIHRVAVDIGAEPCGGPRAGYHRLDIGPDGSMVLDGEPQAGLLALRQRLAPLTLEREPRIMLNPHPEARYEIMLEVLAIMRRAGAYDVEARLRG